MINIEYGVVKELTMPQGMGVRAVVANVVIREHGQEAIDDAALILMRRSFGIGRSHVILRGQYHAILNDADMIPMATEAVTRLFGSADKDNVFRVADALLNLADEVVMHPPENQMKEWKRQQKEIEQSGVLIQLNGKTLVDAR